MKLTKHRIVIAVKQPRWQKFRLSLKHKTTKAKLRSLKSYLTAHAKDSKSKIQVQNYINVLKRSGQLK